jgi:hypothetical protein
VYERRYDSPRNLDRPGDVGEAGETVVEVVVKVGVRVGVVNIVLFTEASPAGSPATARAPMAKVQQSGLV